MTRVRTPVPRTGLPGTSPGTLQSPPSRLRALSVARPLCKHELYNMKLRSSLRHQRLGSLDQTALEALQLVTTGFLHEVLVVDYLLVKQIGMDLFLPGTESVLDLSGAQGILVDLLVIVALRLGCSRK